MSDDDFDPEALFDDDIKAGKAKTSKSKKDKKKTAAKPKKKKKKKKNRRTRKKKLEGCQRLVSPCFTMHG